MSTAERVDAWEKEYAQNRARLNVCRKALAYIRCNVGPTGVRQYREFVEAVESWERLEPELAIHEPQPPNPDAD